MREQLDRTKHTRAHTKKKKKKKTRRRRMSFYAAEERERQKREELSMIGALPPITPQKKGKKRFALENTRKASIALFLFSLEIHIE
jgi:hypothetical protein